MGFWGMNKIQRTIYDLCKKLPIQMKAIIQSPELQLTTQPNVASIKIIIWLCGCFCGKNCCLVFNVF